MKNLHLYENLGIIICCDFLPYFTLTIWGVGLTALLSAFTVKVKFCFQALSQGTLNDVTVIYIPDQRRCWSSNSVYFTLLISK